MLVVSQTSLRLFSLVKALPRIVSVHPGCSLGPLHWRPAAVPASWPCDSTVACVFDDIASVVVVAVETTVRHPLLLKLCLPYYLEKRWLAFPLSLHVPPDDCSPGRYPTVFLMLYNLSFAHHLQVVFDSWFIACDSTCDFRMTFLRILYRLTLSPTVSFDAFNRNAVLCVASREEVPHSGLRPIASPPPLCSSLPALTPLHGF